MSNFTDFNALAEEPDVRLRYVAAPDEVTGADVILLPGRRRRWRTWAICATRDSSRCYSITLNVGANWSVFAEDTKC